MFSPLWEDKTSWTECLGARSKTKILDRMPDTWKEHKERVGVLPYWHNIDVQDLTAENRARAREV